MLFVSPRGDFETPRHEHIGGGCSRLLCSTRSRCLEPECGPLIRPCGREINKARDSEGASEASLNRRLDDVRREERERHCYADRAFCALDIHPSRRKVGARRSEACRCGRSRTGAGQLSCAVRRREHRDLGLAPKHFRPQSLRSRGIGLRSQRWKVDSAGGKASRNRR